MSTILIVKIGDPSGTVRRFTGGKCPSGYEIKKSAELTPKVFAHKTDPSRTVYRTDRVLKCPEGYKERSLSEVHVKKPEIRFSDSVIRRDNKKK